MSFLLYAIGYVVIVTGLAWIATALGVSQVHVLIAASVMLGLGLLTAFTGATARDPA